MTKWIIERNALLYERLKLFIFSRKYAIIHGLYYLNICFLANRINWYVIKNEQPAL